MQYKEKCIFIHSAKEQFQNLFSSSSFNVVVYIFIRPYLKYTCWWDKIYASALDEIFSERNQHIYAYMQICLVLSFNVEENYN